MLLGGVGAAALTLRLHNASDLSAAQPLGPATRTVIFLVDGVSPGELARVRMPHLADLMQRGTTYRRAWVGQMENVPVASAATIATGAIPRNSGVYGDQWRDPQTGIIDRPASPQQVQLGAIDQFMQASGATPLAAALKRVQPQNPIVAVGGSGCAVVNAAASWLADYILCPVRSGKQWVPGSVTGHALPGRIKQAIHIASPIERRRRGAAWLPGEEDAFVTNYCVQVMKRIHPSLVVVSLDELSQRKPTMSARTVNTVSNTLLRGVDRDIGEIMTELRREGLLNRTTFVVTSGTAMPIAGTAVPAPSLARTVGAAGGQLRYLSTGEAAGLGLQDNLQAQPVAQALQGLHLRGLDAVYYKINSGHGWTYEPQYVDPDLAASFSTSASFLLNTVSSAASADVMMILSPGYAVARYGDNGSDGPGIQWDSQHIPLVIAGHGVQPGIASDYPARLVDLAPTIAALMGAGPVASDGTVLADALQQPPARSESIEHAESVRLDFYVSTLQNRLQAAGR